MINYYKKYIKYKNKYLQLRYKLIGGHYIELQTLQQLQPQPPAPQPPSISPQPPSTPQPQSISLVSEKHRIFVIVTHQKWLECFLTEFLEDKYKTTKKKFKNCMFLCISRDDKKNIEVTMVCEGYLDPNDKKDERLYFNTLEFNNHNYTCNHIHSNLLPPNTTMMLVRHGNGFHNSETGLLGLLKKNLNQRKYRDALLTDLGKEQAKWASVAILRHLSTITISHPKHCVRFCASILRRAIQTSSILLSCLRTCNEPYCTGITNDPCVYVFYNINEVVNCDGNTGTLNPENTPTCKRAGVIGENDCSTMTVNSGDFQSNESVKISSHVDQSKILSDPNHTTSTIDVKFPIAEQPAKFDVLSIFTQVQSFNPTSYNKPV
jgi:broad specificity phosphatase PhoE